MTVWFHHWINNFTEFASASNSSSWNMKRKSSTCRYAIVPPKKKKKKSNSGRYFRTKCMTVSAPISPHCEEDSFFSLSPWGQLLSRNVTSTRCTATTFRDILQVSSRDARRCVLLMREKNIVCDYFKKETSKVQLRLF